MQMRKLAVYMPFMVVLLMSFAAPVRSAETTYDKPRVVILPFELNAPPDLDYLKAGVAAMLASRLGVRGGVAVVDQQAVRKVIEETGGTEPAEVGAPLGAELVLAGSITTLGQVISLDVRGVRLKGEPAEERFYATANGPDEVIAAVDQLVVDIGRRMFKGGIKGSGSEVRFGPVGPAVVEPEKTAAVTAETAPEQSLHPDRLFRDQAPPAAMPRRPLP